MCLRLPLENVHYPMKWMPYRFAALLDRLIWSLTNSEVFTSLKACMTKINDVAIHTCIRRWQKSYSPLTAHKWVPVSVCCAGVVSHRQSPGFWHQPFSQSELSIIRADQWEARVSVYPRGKLTTMVMRSPGIWHLPTMPGLMRPHETVSSHLECDLGPGSGYARLCCDSSSASRRARAFWFQASQPKVKKPQVSHCRMFKNWDERESNRDLYFSDCGPSFVSAGGRHGGSVRPRVRGKKHERVLERDVSIPWWSFQRLFRLKHWPETEEDS